MHSLFVENLTVIDFTYFHPTRGLVGESLIVDLELSGELNDEGMLFDFSHVKKQIKQCIDTQVDHKFVVAKNYDKFNMENIEHNNIKLELWTQNGEYYRHISPSEAICLLDAEVVSPDIISEHLQSAVRSVVPDNVKTIALKIYPENIEGPYYHYSHGLKKHFGDCQRIAHGHRSAIEVFKDGVLNFELANRIAQLCQDAYFVTREDISSSQEIDAKSYLTVEYQANQGVFQLTLPEDRCLQMETDTTVELIAQFLLQRLLSEKSDSNLVIKAYEGVKKGASASSD
ncbi:MAG: 6-carboxytetrahydropterin synthase [Gammaproteobacteria bacterium]|nr:6-carboxytetrahydropterin synthase [Gammaproteobacteria bacterium]MDH5628904.1 6-carboxytetrahydropterin synthase [Gammaproteobacteria bacterium]